MRFVRGGGEEFRLGGCEISAGFGDEHFEGVDHRLGGAQVDLLFAGVGIGDLAEKQPGVLGLEDDELAEPGIGFRRRWHARNVTVAGPELGKGEIVEPVGQSSHGNISAARRKLGTGRSIRICYRGEDWPMGLRSAHKPVGATVAVSATAVQPHHHPPRALQLRDIQLPGALVPR